MKLNDVYEVKNLKDKRTNLLTCLDFLKDEKYNDKKECSISVKGLTPNSGGNCQVKLTLESIKLLTELIDLYLHSIEDQIVNLGVEIK